MNRASRALGVSLAVLAASVPLHAQDNTRPFFRFMGDHGQAPGNPSTTDPKTNDPGTTDPTPQQNGALAFDNSDSLPSGPVGTPVHSYYVARGGTPPYAMTLSNASPGIRFSKVASDTWAATGTLTGVGPYPQAKVTLSDATSGTPTVLPEAHSVTENTNPLTFSYGGNLPPTFSTYSTQSAMFGISGGVGPFTWKLTQAPGTVVAANSGTTGSVIATIEQPNTYSGVTLTVSDSIGGTVSRTLDPFTVTDDGAQGLQVSALTPLPATMKVGDTFTSADITVSGSSGPNYYVYAQVYGGQGSAYRTSDYGVDPVVMSPTFTPTAPGVYDVSIQFVDLYDQSRKKLVKWGTTTVADSGFSIAGQFPTTVTGEAGTSTTVYAQVTGATENVDVSVAQPAGLTAYGTYFRCGNGHYCDPSTDGSQPGQSIVYVNVTFPKSGTYQPVRVVATDATGQKVFFEPFKVVSTAPKPMAKLSEFSPNPINAQGSIYGTQIPTTYAKVRGGTSSATVNVNGPMGVNLFGSYSSCANYSYDCNQAGADPDMGVISVYGNTQKAGTFSNIGVTVTDELSGTNLSFAPLTINISAPALGGCSFKNVSSMGGSTGTTKAAVSFGGGTGPYTITTDKDGVTYGSDTGTDGIQHSYDALVAAGTASGTGTVTVKDSTGGTCSGSFQTTSYSYVADQVPVEVQYGGMYGPRLSYLVDSSSGQEAIVTFSGGGGPVGAHPSGNAVVLKFLPPDGTTVTGYSLISKSAPGNFELFGPPQYMYYGTNPFDLYTQNLNGQGAPDPMYSGNYLYQWNVTLSDGTYRPSTPFLVKAH